MSPNARISVGGHLPTLTRHTPPPALPQELHDVIERQIAVLEQTYPAWRIRRVFRTDGTPGGWYATRLSPPTHAQRCAGLLPGLARPDAMSLVTALAVQDEIAHQNGDSGERTRAPAVNRPASPPDGPTSIRKEDQHMDDLYDRDLTGIAFTRMCGGNTGEEGEACVELAPIPGVDDAFALRDSKHPDAGTLRFSGSELRAAGMTTI
ncbi:DUF397 domain-containing protein [Sphaerisporangium rhizosphaerae]|uniref:DUF397 domain-containing protein n=1 Tax=Sphaerisporangium rhizosphaerae TaxID=2269375 RepID=A0ABW2P387_9ACTN